MARPETWGDSLGFGRCDQCGYACTLDRNGNHRAFTCKRGWQGCGGAYRFLADQQAAHATFRLGGWDALSSMDMEPEPEPAQEPVHAPVV